MFVLKTPSIMAWGVLTLVHNDPDWGDAFYAEVEAKVKKPKLPKYPKPKRDWRDIFLHNFLAKQYVPLNQWQEY